MIPSSVEFLGLPGSGKSSVVNSLVSRLRARGFHVHNFRVLADYFRVSRRGSLSYFRSWQALRGLGFSPPFRGKLASFLPKLSRELGEFHSMLPRIVERAIPSRVGQENVSRWLYSELMAYHAWKESEASNGPGHVLIADEAFLQRLAGLCASGRLDGSDFQDFLRLRPHFDRAVLLKVSPEESLWRKNHPPFQDPSLSHLVLEIRLGTASALNQIWGHLGLSEKFEVERDSGLVDVRHQIEMKLFARSGH